MKYDPKRWYKKPLVELKRIFVQLGRPMLTFKAVEREDAVQPSARLLGGWGVFIVSNGFGGERTH